MATTDAIDRVLDRLYADDERQRRANLPIDQRTRNLTRDSGRFLSLLAISMAATRILEIGSSNGVSTIWFANAMRHTGGFVTGTEMLPARAAEANANLIEAGLGLYGEVIAADAAETVASLTGLFDLVFIDAEKEDYIEHFKRIVPLTRPGGAIIADNVISHDLREYQRMLQARDDCDTVTLPLDRGMEFTIRLR